MGIYDSSLTRVRPVFECLFKKDPKGSSWLPELLDLAEQNSLLRKKLARSPGHLIPEKGLLFEKSVPPPAQFLVWLVKNPQKMSWPLRSGKPKKFGQNTQLMREKLFGIHGIEAQEAVKKEEPKKEEKKKPVVVEKPANCMKCNKRLQRKTWYYRNEGYFCSKRCWRLAAKAATKSKESKGKKGLNI